MRRRLRCLFIVWGSLGPLAAAAQPVDPSQPYLQPPPSQPGPATPQPSPAQPSPAQPAPAQPSPAQPSPAQPAPAPQPTSQPAPQPAPAPAYAPPAPAPQPARTQRSAAYDPYQPPPRPQPEQEPQGRTELDIPAMSARLDPLDLVLEGRFGLELEVDLLGFMTVEMIPMFFITDSPVVLNVFSFVGRDAEITQHSNGLGQLVGASLGVGFWLSGKPFRGYVIRALITNYGLLYRSTQQGEFVDRVTYTERTFKILLGSVTRFGPFTLATAFGIGYELNGQERCGVQENDNGVGVQVTSSGCDEVQILIDDANDTYTTVTGFLHPFSIEGRISLGVTLFD